MRKMETTLTLIFGLTACLFLNNAVASDPLLFDCKNNQVPPLTGALPFKVSVDVQNNKFNSITIQKEFKIGRDTVKDVTIVKEAFSQNNVGDFLHVQYTDETDSAVAYTVFLEKSFVQSPNKTNETEISLGDEAFEISYHCVRN